jgi:hypothetical protein
LVYPPELAGCVVARSSAGVEIELGLGIGLREQLLLRFGVLLLALTSAPNRLEHSRVRFLIFAFLSYLFILLIFLVLLVLTVACRGSPILRIVFVVFVFLIQFGWLRAAFPLQGHT